MVQRKNEGIQKSFRAIAKKASDNPQQQTRQGKGIAVNKLQIPQSAVGEQNNADR
jgi:hypothetical protein